MSASLNISAKENDTLSRLVDMTNQTCLIAIDKTMASVNRSNQNRVYWSAAKYANTIAERMVRCSREVRLCIPVDKRGGL